MILVSFAWHLSRGDRLLEKVTSIMSPPRRRRRVVQKDAVLLFLDFRELPSHGGGNVEVSSRRPVRTSVHSGWRQRLRHRFSLPHTFESRKVCWGSKLGTYEVLYRVLQSKNENTLYVYWIVANQIYCTTCSTATINDNAKVQSKVILS